MDINGKTWKFADNIDTDVIIPARFLNVSDKEELAKNCFADLRPHFADGINPGDVIVGGNNFGCGSSREHAPWAIEVNNIHLVIAESFARIFRQNMFNCGMMAVELPVRTIDGIFKDFAHRETYLETDLEKSVFTITADGQHAKIPFLISNFDRALIMTGGWVDYADSKY